MSDITTKCLIIGAGPAGYTAAIYASRANLKPILIEGLQPGGQLTTTTEIENFPGYPAGISGPKMMEDFRAQAQRFGCEIHSGLVTEVDFTKRPFKVIVDGSKTYEAATVIIATGASAKYLGLPDEDRFKGMGVSACATCDGFFFRGRQVAVVGGGDTACEEALYLSTLASKVYMIVRKDHLRASRYMQQRVSSTENIEVLYNTRTVGLTGDELLEGARLVRNEGTPTQEEFDIAVEGFFLAIGHTPNTDIFKGSIELDAQGYIVTKGHSTATTVDGVYAAGDVADNMYQQAIVAAGSGCKAAIDAETFLLLNPDA